MTGSLAMARAAHHGTCNVAPAVARRQLHEDPKFLKNRAQHLCRSRPPSPRRSKFARIGTPRISSSCAVWCMCVPAVQRSTSPSSCSLAAAAPAGGMRQKSRLGSTGPGACLLSGLTGSVEGTAVDFIDRGSSPSWWRKHDPV